MATLFATGLSHSRAALAFLHLPGDMLLRKAHTLAAYWALPLIGVHVGLHWERIATGFGKMLRATRSSLVKTITLRAVSVMIAVCGIYASFDRDMGLKLFAGYSFDYWSADSPAILFFAGNLAIIGLYVCMTHYALKLPNHRRRQTGGTQENPRD
jgi:hypothetical protein